MPNPTTRSRFARHATGALLAPAVVALLAVTTRCDAQPPAAARPDSVTRAEANGTTTPAGRPSPAALERARAATRTALDLARRATRGAGTTADPRLADSARAAFEAAAELAPAAGDWLRLRAAALTADPAARARTYAALAIPAARERARWTEALARERFGDLRGADSAWRTLGRDARALRARLAQLPPRPDSADATPAHREIRDALLRLATDTDDAPDAREAIALLDSAFAPLAPTEELAVARAAATLGQPSRAALGFSRVPATSLTASDHYSHGAALLRLGRHTDAARAFGRARHAGGPLAGRAAYERARALLRAGQGTAASQALAELRRANDAEWSARALYLLADLASDADRERQAIAYYQELARRFPQSALSGPARFRAATILLALDGRSAARAVAQQLDSIRTLSHEDALAAGYWAGRAWALAGDSARARERWREIAAREPRSYYAMLSARRLGEPPWAPPAGAPLPADPVAGSTAERVALLDELGLGDEVGLERAWLTRWADTSVTRLLAAAAAFHTVERASPGIQLAARALDRGAPPSAPLYRALYPFPFDSLIRAEARKHGIDPDFAAALIRQESNFTPGATSPAGARGLMQVMPAVGRSIAGRRDWDASLLYDPEVNVPLGMRHLAASLGRHPHPAYALAAYNAGEGRLRTWRRRAGYDDPELFVERIPYAETRDYVRIVLRNAALYEGLY